MDLLWSQGSPCKADAGRSAIAALPQAERDAAIRGMVEGLAARLKADGGTLPDWLRLIRSQAVLGDREAARESVTMARGWLSQDASALAALDALAAELTLKETRP